MDRIYRRAVYNAKDEKLGQIRRIFDRKSVLIEFSNNFQGIFDKE